MPKKYLTVKKNVSEISFYSLNGNIRVVIEKLNNLLEKYSEYDELFLNAYDYGYLIVGERRETDSERKKRLEQAKRRREQRRLQKEKKKQQLIKEAQKLGLKLVE